ncbi:hypothetical protein NFI96_027659 [Prochilodus magdalenae]|nr:hypothetical protein NFI96_027659 [Prochilodus magdalenae]
MVLERVPSGLVWRRFWREFRLVWCGDSSGESSVWFGLETVLEIILSGLVWRRFWREFCLVWSGDGSGDCSVWFGLETVLEIILSGLVWRRFCLVWSGDGSGEFRLVWSGDSSGEFRLVWSGDGSGDFYVGVRRWHCVCMCHFMGTTICLHSHVMGTSCGMGTKNRVTMPPRISPLKDAINHVVSKTDKTFKLEVKYINTVKGRGVFAKSPICKGDFVVEYRGDIINDAESQRRRRLYHPSCAAFMFAFKWKGKTWCIDASREDGSFGRLVNDDHRRPNCRMKKIDVNGNAHLCLFALNHIEEGEEITYDYGGEDCPWRTQSTDVTANTMAVDYSSPSVQSETRMVDATPPNSTSQESTDVTANRMAVDYSSPSVQSETRMVDATPPNSTSQESTDVTANRMAVDYSSPSVQSETRMVDATPPNSTSQESTDVTANRMAVDYSSPSVQSETRMVDATPPNSTSQESTDVTANTMAVDYSSPSVQSETRMVDATPPNSTSQESTDVTANRMAVDYSSPSVQSETRMVDATPPNSTSQESTDVTANTMAVDYSSPSVQSETRMVDATPPNSTSQESTDVTANRMAVDYSSPSVQSETRMVDATPPNSTSQESTDVTANRMAVDYSSPSVQSETRMVDATPPNSTSQSQESTDVTANRMAVDYSSPSVQSETRMVDATSPNSTSQEFITDFENNEILVPRLRRTKSVIVSKLLKAQGLISNSEVLVKNACEFQAVHSEKWNELISATALRNIREAKWNVPALMPFTQDVQKMHAYLSQVQDECYNSLSQSPSTKAWAELAKVCLAQIILFNRRREGEVASMPLSAFSLRDTSDSHEDIDWALSEVEKKLCRHFSRIVIRGKRGRPVPVLLTPKMLCALELLVKQRKACGVLKDNGYMFARPEAMTHFRGSDCIRGFAKVCGAKCSKSLTSTRLRKHAATLSTVLNMTNTEMDQLANFLGHDIRIHREFYRLPEKTLQLAKISKILMALEQGRIAEFQGKNLDEIGIEPDEKVLDSGEDDEVEDEEVMTMQEGSCSSTIMEASAVETLPPSLRNDMPPPHNTCEQTSDERPSGASVMRSSKGKVTPKKTPWQQTEVQAVERHMNRFLTSCIVPSKSDCEKCLRAEPEALKNRDWKNLKFYVYNRITAYKRKIQHK